MQGVANTNAMTENEQKIRDELESEIERGLEEEIKDGIYGLALRLQRLYLHKQHRKMSASSTSSNREPSHGPKSERLSELNIIIRSDGKSKIETYEVKPSFHNLVRPYSSRSKAKQVKLRNCISQLDQSKLLRPQKGFIGGSKMNSSLGFEPQEEWLDASCQNDKQFERKNKKKIGSEWKY